MSTIDLKDFRRTDLRTNALDTPYWISSQLINGAVSSGLADHGLLLFSFPKAAEKTIIWDIVVQIATSFTTGTTLNMGYGTIATDAPAEDDHITYSNTDDYMRMTSDFTAVTAAWYYPQAGNAWLAVRASGVHTAGLNLIVGAASTVPCIFLSPAAATIVAGKIQVHMLVSVIPGT
jgi:hypothetical protein